MARRTLLIALLVVAAGAVAAAAATGPPYGSAPINRARAHRAAARLLAALSPPPGAIRAPTDPAPGGDLSQPGYDEATPNLVDAHAWFTIHRSARATLAWVARHLPPGIERGSRGTEGGRDGVDEIDWAVSPTAGLTEQHVAVSVAPLGGGRTAVRLDGEAVWLTPRPRWERIPSDVSAASVTGHGQSPGGGTARRSRPIVLSRTQTRALATFVNRLDVGQPGVTSCPEGFDVSTTIRFSAANGRRVATVVESPTGCPSVALTIGRRRGPGLQDGWGAQSVGEELVRLHAIGRCTATGLATAVAEARTSSGAPALTISLRSRSSLICALPDDPRVALTTATGRVLAGHDHSVGSPGPPAILYPGETFAISVGLRGCPARPAATSARVTFGAAAAPLAVALDHPVHPCPSPLRVSGVASPG